MRRTGLEVWRLPFEEARGAPEKWPAHWPGLDSSAVRPAGYGRPLRILLPTSELARLEDLMRTLADSRAVELGGRKFGLDVRLPFPGDEAWRGEIPRVH